MGENCSWMKGLVLVSNLLPEERLLLLNMHAWLFTPPGIGNLDPSCQMPGPSLSLQDQTSRAQRGAVHASVQCFRAGSAAGPMEPLPSRVPSRGGQHEQCESLGSQCRANSLGTRPARQRPLCFCILGHPGS